MTRTIALLIMITSLSGAAQIPEDSLDAQWDAEQRALVDFAMDRFAAAGLELPADLKITFSADEAWCHGYGGVYLLADVEARICRFSKINIVHELAHAWIETSLSDADRDAFLELRGLDTWLGGSEWDQRAGEHAAEVLAWELMDRDISVRWVEPGPDDAPVETSRLLTIDNSAPAELAGAYRLLTGADPTNRQVRALAASTASGQASPEARRVGHGHDVETDDQQHAGPSASPEAMKRP